jgi:hypothetical protein
MERFGFLSEGQFFNPLRNMAAGILDGRRGRHITAR